ncbi:MAG: hypothetical protein RL660_2624 [Bacteroidota bacterium]|jgi:hypothetical protein
MLQILIISLKSHTEFTPLLPTLLQAMFASLPAGALVLFLRKLKTKNIKRISKELPTTGNLYLDIAIVSSIVFGLITLITLIVSVAASSAGVVTGFAATLLAVAGIVRLIAFVVGLITSWMAVFDLRKNPLSDERKNKTMKAIAAVLAGILTAFALITFLVVLLVIGILALLFGW